MSIANQVLPIQMVDLKTQYHAIKAEVDAGVIACFENAHLIGGAMVNDFQTALQDYLQVKYVIPCANGTDALQIALMALGLKAGDEVIVPAFTYVASAEVIALLGLKPIMVDVDLQTFNVTAANIEPFITSKTKAIIPVHLFGQSVDIEPIIHLAKKYNLFIIEDNAQAIGADYSLADGTIRKTGTLGNIGCTSFYPSKNLGCYGDGGAMMTNDDELANLLRSIANHGQAKQRYYHDYIGVNSRLDAVQAVVLSAKLKRLDNYNHARQVAAKFYDQAFANLDQVQTPFRQANSTHVFHQYTLMLKEGNRDELQQYLTAHQIPSMIYYPVPLYKQKAFQAFAPSNFELPVTEKLCQSVISLPMHSELREEQLAYIAEKVTDFFA